MSWMSYLQYVHLLQFPPHDNTSVDGTCTVDYQELEKNIQLELMDSPSKKDH